MNRKFIIGLLVAAGIVIVIVVAAVSGGAGNGVDTSLSQTSSSHDSSNPSSGSDTGGSSNPLDPAPVPTPTGTNPEDIYPGGIVPDHIDPVRDDTISSGDAEDGNDLSGDGNTLPPGYFGDWKPSAEAFGKAFADTTVGKAAWLNAMRPYVSDSLFNKLSQGDPVSAKLTYTGVVLSNDNGGGMVKAAVSYGPQAISIVLIQDGTRWIVDDITSYER